VKSLLIFALIVGGWLIFAYLSYLCFDASRDDGDRTPQGKMARGCAFMFGMIFLALVVMPLADLIEYVFKWSQQ
jgi:hypothetical protein